MSMKIITTNNNRVLIKDDGTEVSMNNGDIVQNLL